MVIFTTEAHPAGYEASSSAIHFSQAADGRNDKFGEYALAQLVLSFGVGDLVFHEDGNWLADSDGSTWVRFSSVRKLQHGESLASRVTAFSELFN